MSDLSEIYSALMVGQRAVEALETWVKSVDGRDSLRSYTASIRDGIAAFARLEGDLRNGSEHVATADYRVLSNCECSAPNARPPCSWCTTPHDEEDES